MLSTGAGEYCTSHNVQNDGNGNPNALSSRVSQEHGDCGIGHNQRQGPKSCWIQPYICGIIVGVSWHGKLADDGVR